MQEQARGVGPSAAERTLGAAPFGRRPCFALHSLLRALIGRRRFYAPPPPPAVTANASGA